MALAAGVALAVQPSTPRVPLEPGIPNEQALIDAGLAAVPGPGQPTRPVAVDRVLVDGAATYVQYHTAAPSPSGTPGFFIPTLTDDRGAPVTADFSSAGSSTEDAAFPLPLPGWLPWPPAPLQHGYLILPPLLDLLSELLTLLGSRVPQRGGPIQRHAARIFRRRWCGPAHGQVTLVGRNTSPPG